MESELLTHMIYVSTGARGHVARSIQEVSMLAPICGHSRDKIKPCRAPLNLPSQVSSIDLSTKAYFRGSTCLAFSLACCTATMWDLTAAGALVAAALSPRASISSRSYVIATMFCVYTAFQMLSTGVFRNGFAFHQLRHAHSLRMVAPIATPLIIKQRLHAIGVRWLGWSNDTPHARMHSVHAGEACRSSDRVIQQHRQHSGAASSQIQSSGSIGGDTGVLAPQSGSSSAPFASSKCPRIMHCDAPIWRHMGLSHAVQACKPGGTPLNVSSTVPAGRSLSSTHHRGSMHELHALRSRSPSPQPIRAGSGMRSEAAKMADARALWHQRGFCVALIQSR
jgi:hypothetical protein